MTWFGYCGFTAKAVGGIPIKGARHLCRDKDAPDVSGYVRSNAAFVADEATALALWRARGEPAMLLRQTH